METFTKNHSDAVKVTYSSDHLFKQAEQTSRKCRIGKAVCPGPEKGSLEITLLYRNKASFLRENVVINEFVPANFSVTRSSNRFGSMQKDGGTMISWLIDEVSPDEEIEIRYSLKADDATSSLKHVEGKAFK